MIKGTEVTITKDLLGKLSKKIILIFSDFVRKEWEGVGLNPYFYIRII